MVAELATTYGGGVARNRPSVVTEGGRRVASARWPSRRAAAGQRVGYDGGFVSAAAVCRSARSPAWLASTPDRMVRATLSSSATCGLVSE